MPVCVSSFISETGLFPVFIVGKATKVDVTGIEVTVGAETFAPLHEARNTPQIRMGKAVLGMEAPTFDKNHA